MPKRDRKAKFSKTALVKPLGLSFGYKVDVSFLFYRVGIAW